MTTKDLKNMIRNARLEVFTDQNREKPWRYTLHTGSIPAASMVSYGSEKEALSAGEECRANMLRSMELA